MHLSFQGVDGFGGGRVERSQERRGARQIALHLCHPRLIQDGIDVVRCDIENLIILPERFGETPEYNIGCRMLGE